MDEYLNQIFSDLQLTEPDYYENDFAQWVKDLNDEGQRKLVYEDLKRANASSLKGISDYTSFNKKLTGQDDSRLAELAPDYIAQKEKDKKKAKELGLGEPFDPSKMEPMSLKMPDNQLKDIEQDIIPKSTFETKFQLPHQDNPLNVNLTDKPDWYQNWVEDVARKESGEDKSLIHKSNATTSIKQSGQTLNPDQKQAIKDRADNGLPLSARNVEQAEEVYSFLNSFNNDLGDIKTQLRLAYAEADNLGDGIGGTNEILLNRFYLTNLQEKIGEFLESDEGIGIYNLYTSYAGNNNYNQAWNAQYDYTKSLHPDYNDEKAAAVTNTEISKTAIRSAENITSTVMEEQFDGIVPVLDEIKYLNDEREKAVRKKAQEIYSRSDWVHTEEGYNAAYFEALKEIPISPKLAELQKQHEKNIQKFMGEGVIPLVDVNGGWIKQSRNDKDFLDRQRLQKKQVVELGMMSLDKQAEMLFKYETEILAVVKDILNYGVGNITKDASIAQWLGDVYTKLDEGDNSWNTLEGKIRMLKNGNPNSTDGLLPPLPGGNPFTDKYNDLLQKYITMSAAITLNYDPLSVERDETWYGQLGQGFIDAVPATFDFDAEYVNDFERVQIFSQELESQGYTLSAKEKERVRQTTSEMVGGSLPTLIKMGVEIYATTLLTGGAGTIGAVSRGAGNVATSLFTGLRASPRIAKAAGTFTNMYVHESIGLLGSNFIGSNLTHSEEMPVFTFAAGSALGRMGFAALGRSLGPGFAATWNRIVNSPTYGGTVAANLNTLSKSVPTGLLSYGAKKVGEAGIGTTAIKLGEVTSGAYDVARGDISYDEFWHHITDRQQLVSLFGGLLVMGTFGKPGSGEMYKRVRDDASTIVNGKGFAKIQRLGLDFGLGKIKPLTKDGNFGNGLNGTKKTHWTDAEIDIAKEKKLKELKESEEYKSMTPEERIKYEINIERTAESLKMKSEIDGIASSQGLYDRYFFGANNLRTNFETAINQIREGKFNELYTEVQMFNPKTGKYEKGVMAQESNTTDVLAEMAHQFGSKYVSLRIQEATGMDTINADRYVKMAIEASRATTDRGFTMNSPYRYRYLETAIVDNQITQKRKAIKENKELSDGERDRQLEKLDNLAEQNKTRQDDLISKQEAFNKKKAEQQKLEADYDRFIEVEEGKTLDQTYEEVTGQKPEATGETGLDFGIQGTTKDGKTVYIVDPKSTKVFGGSRENLFKERGAIGTYIHEAIHPVVEKYTNVDYLTKKIREKNPDLPPDKAQKRAIRQKNKFVKDFINVLKQTGEYEAVLARVKQNVGYEVDKLTNEWFSVYGEMVNRGELQFSKKARSIFKNFTKTTNEFLNKANPDLKADFKGGKDVYDFITSFARGKGRTENPVYKKAVKEYEEIVRDYDLNQPLRNTVQRDAKDVMAKEFNRVTGFESMLKQGMSREEAVKRAQEIWDKRGADEFISEIYTDGILDKLIMSYIPIEKPPGWLKEQVKDPISGEMINAGDLEFKQAVYTELISHIRNFKVGKQTTSFEKGLFAWVNSQLLNKVGEVYKKGQMGTKEQYDMTFDQAREAGKEQGKEDSVFEEKEVAKDRSPEKIIADLKIDARTKRLLDNDMLTVDFSKISDVEAKGGKNQKISPFIRDYKKQAGDNLGKTIYEDVLLKGKNVEYLRENFPAIVENVDVGYLSKNFPFLIEKRVDGVYTKNWQGKKVDKFTLKESGMTSQPEYIRLDPEFNTEFNKQQFVDALTKFPDSKNVARDRAAKNKALAYQMGADIAIAEFRKQTNEAVDSQLKITQATEGIAKVRRDVQKYRDLKAEHPEWTEQRLSRETNGVTPTNYFDRIEVLRETIVDQKIRMDDQPLFKAYKESRAEINEAELPKNVSTVIENSLFRRNTIKNMTLEERAELFDKSNEMKEWFIKNKVDLEAKITTVPWRKMVDEIFPNYSKDFRGRLVNDLIRGQKIYDRIEANRAKNNNKRARDLSKRFESIVETSIESAGIPKLMDRLFLPEGISNKEVFLDKDIRAEATQSTLRYTTERIKQGGLDAATAMWSMKGQYTGGRGEAIKDASRYKNADIASVPLYFENVWKPAMEANGYTVEYKSGNPSIFKNGKSVEVKYPARLKKGGAELKKIMQPDFVNKKNQLKLNDPKFKAEIERQNKEADLANTELQAQMLDKANAFHLGTESPLAIHLWSKNLQSDMGGVLRGAAYVTEIYQPLKGESYITGKDINSTTLRYEHSPPADVMLDRLGEIYFDSKNVEVKDVFDKAGNKIGERVELTKEAQAKLDKLMSEYTVKIIPESMDVVLKEAGLESMTPGEKDRYNNWRTIGDSRMRPLIDVNPKSANYGKTRGEDFTKAESRFEEVMKVDQDILVESGIYNRNSVKNKSIEDVIESTDKLDKTLDNARKIDPKVKKIRVFDFDDTIARTNSKVFANKGGERKTLTAEEFAKQGERLINEGWKMDFSDFNRVVEGKKGPLFDLMKKMKEAAGERDLFILTARAQESAPAIKEFLDAMGIEIPLENITGLGNSTGEAKAEWILNKTSEGYNDFYFADDAIQNVKAVKDILSQVDVKSQVQQARFNRNSVKLDETFNKIIEGKTGIEFYKEFSEAKGKVRGAKKGKIRLTLPSAQDFAGLMDYTLGKGKVGEAQREFYTETLYKPYSRAQRALSTDRVNLMADFKTLKKELDVPKDLREKTKSGFTKEQAVRVYLWNKTGKKIPGISPTDAKELTNLIETDGKLKAFADSLLGLTKGDGYNSPKESWLAGTITTDLIDLLQTTKRSKYLEEWQANVDVLFSNKNLNKLEAGFGRKYREALENSLARMKAGKNRIEGGNSVSDKVLDYINGAQGTIMFLNMRSALLQTISSANYINFDFNNPLRAGQAFANQKQYWKDFTKLMNSEYLLDRRNGLKLNISESEIADAAATGKNKAKAAVAYILEKGYTPTKFADSFAIASGGAMWYRNKIRSLKKKGMSEAEAEKIAYDEWIEVSEKSQQSSDPSKISQQQSSDMGRIFLQFVNTPMQYNRLMIADGKDLINGRGNPIQKISRIIYYGAVQNMWFNFMQSGMFALGFGDFGEAEIEDKTLNMVNSMSDGILRGTGLPGMTISVLKNFAIDIMKESGKKRPDYQDSLDELLNFSPAIKSKFTRIKSAIYEVGSDQKQQEIIDKGFSLDNPAFKAFAHVTSAVTNLPLDRGVRKLENLQNASADDTETWMSIANILGWPEWQLQTQEQKDKEWQKEKEDFKYRQAKEDPTKYSKAEQIDILTKHGYSEEDIKKMKDSGTRAATIKAAEEKSGKVYTSRIKKEEKVKDEKTFSPYIKEEDRTDLSEEDKKTNANVKKYFNLNKAEQVAKLDSLGFTKKQIRTQFSTEQKRVDKLLRLIEGDSIPPRLMKSQAIPASDRTPAQVKLYKMTKSEQVKMLKSLGISESDIESLTYEADRVKKIEELQKKKSKQKSSYKNYLKQKQI